MHAMRLHAPLFSDMQNLYAGLQWSFLVLPTIRVCREFSGQKRKMLTLSVSSLDGAELQCYQGLLWNRKLHVKLSADLLSA
jgi:hypothetical protein